MTCALAFAGSVLARLLDADKRDRSAHGGGSTLEAAFAVASEGQLFGLLASWLTLNFRWVQLQHPGATLAMEQLVLAASPVVALVSLARGLVAAVGAGQAPFHLMAAAILLHYAFLARPLRSSFVSHAKAGSDPYAPAAAITNPAHAAMYFQ